MQWYGLKVLSVYDTDGDPVSEFVDEGFVENWRGIESSVFLASAASEGRARELVAEDVESGPWVNIYGQSLRQRLVTIDLYRVPETEFATRDEEVVVEIYSDLWSVTTDEEPEGFLCRRLPSPDEKTPMIDPIALYEHRVRYEELRGPL